MCSLSIPVIYIYVTQETALMVLVPLCILAIVIDFMSRKPNIVQKFMHSLFGDILRPHEKKGGFGLNGASWVLISAIVCVVIFPKLITVTGFTILIISDLSAALIGKKWGKTNFLDKSFEGSTAFVITAMIVVTVWGKIFQLPLSYFLIGYFASIVGAVFEASSTRFKIDDNLAIPVSIGFIMWFGNEIAKVINASYLDKIIF